MKLPNGFGTVYKLSGNRRNPYVAKKTKGWEIDPKTGKSKQLYTVVGYYPTRKEALTALAEFNANPYDVNAAKVHSRMYMSDGLMNIFRLSVIPTSKATVQHGRYVINLHGCDLLM